MNCKVHRNTLVANKDTQKNTRLMKAALWMILHCELLKVMIGRGSLNRL